MSMVLSFTPVTPEELEQASQDPEWARKVPGAIVRRRAVAIREFNF